MAQNLLLVEFHRGWMIEVETSPEGFLNVCRSPFGEELSDGDYYQCRQQAWQAALEMIDLFYACYALKRFLRDAFEEGLLDFDDWQRLSHCLDHELP
jgi:hypothetical protein